MDAIRTYVDNVFQALPQTAEVQTLKREILASMEEKYLALKEEGKGEHEAIGSVIANFGNLDEIVAELGITSEEMQTSPKDEISLTRDEAQGYLAQMKKNAIGVGIGVWLILIGAMMFLLSRDALGIVVLSALSAVAVALFVVNGMRMMHYEEYERKHIRLEAATRTEAEEQRRQFMPRFAMQIATGVMLIILSVGIGIPLFLYTDVSFAVAFPVLGAGTCLVIVAGTQLMCFDILLGRGDYQNKRRNTKLERLIGTAAAVYFPVISAVYLAWSFVGDAWRTSWIIWPIAGVLFGAFAGGISVWLGMQDE